MKYHQSRQATYHIRAIKCLVSFLVRYENTLSKIFKNNTREPQGDSASSLQFAYYLAKMQDPIKSNQPLDRSHVKQTIRSNIVGHPTKHNYCMVIQKDQIDIEMKYGDKIGKLTSNHSPLEIFKYHMSKVLQSRDVIFNQNKTEQYLIYRTTHEWRKCKHLYSMLDTIKDIKRRKVHATNAADRTQIVFDNKKFTPETKMTAFRIYVEPVFLYNCEIWAISWKHLLKQKGPLMHFSKDY